MPKKIISEKFQCGICEKTYDTYLHADRCETTHEKEKLEKDWRAIFPTRWKNDDRWNYHCVICGVQLLKFRYIYEGHETEVGAETYHYKGIVCKLEGGRYCEVCYKKRRQVIVDAWNLYNEHCPTASSGSNDYTPFSGELIKKGL